MILVGWAGEPVQKGRVLLAYPTFKSVNYLICVPKRAEDL
jgi:hypothetical protein